MKAIKQFIAEHLINTEIFEMAKSLSDYKDLVEHISKPLISHIILIMKAKKENSIEFIQHWKKEVKIFLMEFYKVRLKTKNSYEARYKHVYDKLCDELELDTLDNLAYYCYSKLSNEGYDLDNENILDEFKEITKEFQSEYLNGLIETIASNDINKINSFINKL